MQADPLSKELGLIVMPGRSHVDELPAKDEIISLLKVHGVVILRDFPTDLSRFHELVAQLAPGVERGVVEGGGELQLHGEACYMSIPLDVLWFYCITPPTVGGQTKVCDGIRVARELSPASRQFFIDNPLTYDIQFSATLSEEQFGGNLTAEEVSQLIEECYGVTCTSVSKEGIKGWSSRSALIRTRWSGEEAFVTTLLHALDPCFAEQMPYRLTTKIPDEVLAEVREVTDRFTVLIHWERDDIAIIDNSRVMHGRRSYKGPRKIVGVNGVLAP